MPRQVTGRLRWHGVMQLMQGVLSTVSSATRQSDNRPMRATRVLGACRAVPSKRQTI